MKVCINAKEIKKEISTLLLVLNVKTEKKGNEIVFPIKVKRKKNNQRATLGTD